MLGLLLWAWTDDAEATVGPGPNNLPAVTSHYGKLVV
jgi:hypothetical protein